MLDRYIYRGTQKLRLGYTTGSCAAGAAKAAAFMLFSGEEINSIKLMTPAGIELELDIHDICIKENSVSCAVVKDGGDDPDATDGIMVYAEVSKAESGVHISGGEGIGRVTKAGLDQPAGEWAINSVPRKMIISAVCEAAESYGYEGGFEVTVSVPGGVELAAKTYNPHIGIEGGISIIGTSGIVEPMSSAALVDTIRTELNVRRAAGNENMLLTLGNYSGSFLEENMPFINEKSVKCSNFIGDAIDIGLELSFKKILIIGHIGKMVKLGAGIMNTHSSHADGRMEVLVTCALLAGADTETLKKIPDCATADAALDIIAEAGLLKETMKVLSEKIDFHLNSKVKGEAVIGAVVFSYKHDITFETKSAGEIIAALSEEKK